MKFETVKLSEGTDIQVIEKRINQRMGMLLAKYQQQQAVVPVKHSRITAPNEGMIDRWELTRLSYIEAKVDRIRESIDCMGLHELSQKSVSDIVKDPNNILSHVLKFRVSISRHISYNCIID
jgi:hypothetical protein